MMAKKKMTKAQAQRALAVIGKAKGKKKLNPNLKLKKASDRFKPTMPGSEEKGELYADNEVDE